MTQDDFGLPRDLGDGLLLRWATPTDAEELAAFNSRIHSDDPDEPAPFLGDWTRDLMNNHHPTTQASDFTVVVDTNDDDKIVSSMTLISQTWTYDGIAFGVGRPELVGTDDNYRRRGLVRRQFEIIHAKSKARGELVQAITGIPWYYRLFGYEMALDLSGSRHYFWARHTNSDAPDDAPYRLRAATTDDIALLADLYASHCRHSRVVRVRDDALWRYEMVEPTPASPYARNFHIVETAAGETAAYVEYRQWRDYFLIRELAAAPGQSLRAVALFLMRAFRQEADRLNEERDKPLTHVSFGLGAYHPVYDALEPELEKLRKPYAWYIRVADLPGFLRHIGPALEKRLAASVMAGHSGALRLNFYHSQLTLEFEGGALADVGSYTPEKFEDGDAFFPDLTFLQLVFGRRSLEELQAARADCFADSNEATVLLNILFPQCHSQVVGLG